MAKKVNITDKLRFNENPVLAIGDIEAEVKADAKTVLKLMGVFAKKNDAKAIVSAMNLIFDKKDVEKICAIKENGKSLSGKSLAMIVQCAIELVMGENSGE